MRRRTYGQCGQGLRSGLLARDDSGILRHLDPFSRTQLGTCFDVAVMTTVAVLGAVCNPHVAYPPPIRSPEVGGVDRQ